MAKSYSTAADIYLSRISQNFNHWSNSRSLDKGGGGGFANVVTSLFVKRKNQIKISIWEIAHLPLP